MKLIRKGKVKNIYDIGDEKLMFEFSDRISCFDVILNDTIPSKGEVLCRMGEFWFKTLDIPNHMVRREGPNKMIVKKYEVIPMECVVRGYLYGSFYEKVKKGEAKFSGDPVMASKLPEIVFDPTTKIEKKDRPVTKSEVVSKGWLTGMEFELLKKKSIDLYKKISERVGKAGFILSDIKFEFGKDGDFLVLIDSVGPVELRLWPKD